LGWGFVLQVFHRWMSFWLRQKGQLCLPLAADQGFAMKDFARAD